MCLLGWKEEQMQKGRFSSLLCGAYNTSYQAACMSGMPSAAMPT